MQGPRVREAMDVDGLAFAMSVGFRDPAVVELIGLAGFDAVFLDMEHSAFDFGLIEEMVARVRWSGSHPLVRVPDNNPKAILRVLDMSAQGVFVPHIRGVDDARQAIRAVRYPPVGERGSVSTSRAARFGLVDWTEHVATSNRQILLAVIVEDIGVAREVDAIASLDGLDLVLVGPFDLATSMGIFEDNHPEVRSVVEAIARTVRAVGGARLGFVLNHRSYPLGVPGLLKLGASFALCLPSPHALLLDSLRAQAEAVRAEARRLKPN